VNNDTDMMAVYKWHQKNKNKWYVDTHYYIYLCTPWKLKEFNCACNRNYAISRLLTSAVQSWDCALVPCNLKIA